MTHADQDNDIEVFYFEPKIMGGYEKWALILLAWGLAVTVYFLVESGFGTPAFWRVLLAMPILIGAVATIFALYGSFFADLVVDTRGVRCGLLARIPARRVADWHIVERLNEDALWGDMMRHVFKLTLDGRRYHPFRIFMQWGEDTVMLIRRDHARLFPHIIIATNDPDAFAAGLARMTAARDRTQGRDR